MLWFLKVKTFLQIASCNILRVYNLSFPNLSNTAILRTFPLRLFSDNLDLYSDPSLASILQVKCNRRQNIRQIIVFSSQDFLYNVKSLFHSTLKTGNLVKKKWRIKIVSITTVLKPAKVKYIWKENTTVLWLISDKEITYKACILRIEALKTLLIFFSF